MKLLFIVVFSFVAVVCFTQNIHLLVQKPGVSLRGLSVVNDNVLWASGSKGTVARSVDGGKNFQWMKVAGYEERDFRDVEAFDAGTAIIMAVAEPAVILKTNDGGKTWKKVFEDSTKGMFLDAMCFMGRFGVVVGDPVNNKMFVAYTRTGGDTWRRTKDSIFLPAGEAFFASSGTNVKLLPVKRNMFRHAAVSGGTEANFIGDKKYKLDMVQGKESQGANSMAVNAGTKGIVVTGGDFANDTDTTGNCLVSADFGKTWQKPQTAPHGYRSCVEYVTARRLIACGTSGVDVSEDGGMNWKLVSGESFHVCQRAKLGMAVFLAGKDGRIGRME